MRPGRQSCQSGILWYGSRDFLFLTRKDALVQILAILRDVTPLNYLLAIQDDLKKLGHVVTIVCEADGAAAATLTRANIAFQTSLPAQVKTFDIAVIGCSTGSALEMEALYRLAGQLPTLGICDIKGAHTRHNRLFAEHYVVPDHFVALDLPQGSYTVIGDANVRPLETPSHSMRNAVQAWRDGSDVVVLAAQRNFEMIDVTARCVLATPNQKLLLGMHPDRAKWPELERVERLCEQHSGKIEVTERVHTGLGTLQALASLEPSSAVLVTSYSGSGTTAAAAGYRVALIDGPEVRTEFARSCPPGTGPLPLSHLIGAPVVTAEQAPLDFFSLTYPDEQKCISSLCPVNVAAFIKVITKVANC